MTRAVVLFSGGLDSILALRIVRGLGIEVLAVNVATPFTGRTRGREEKTSAESRAQALGAEFRRVYAGADYLEMLSGPKFGYGRNFNPCIDCKIYMLKKAAGEARSRGAAFLVTGDVLGQRPMSQGRRVMAKIDEEAGLAGMVLRPLSARLLDETFPELEGTVDRGKFFAFSGRSRKPQAELARSLGISDYPNAAGGCLLTDEGFARKLKDLASHEELEPGNIEILKTGRHFRISGDFKLVVGRDEAENIKLSGLAGPRTVVFSVEGGKGPLGLGFGLMGELEKNAACGIIARYVSGPGPEVIRISGAQEETRACEKLSEAEIDRYRI